ncbi:hypothetical protein QEH59_18805, partial [Coraliomargarita sp. SDUM461004]
DRQKMEYLLLIHKNSETPPSESEWNEFFEEANGTGMFQGGSQLGSTRVFGREEIPNSTNQIGGFMRFETSKVKELESLLTKNPVVKNGGSIELIEMPKTTNPKEPIQTH